MVGSLLLRGMLAGILAGLLAFGFARIFGEPQVDRAIAFEESNSVTGGHSHGDHDADVAGQHAHGEADAQAAAEPEEELVSRGTQSTIGLLTGVVVFSTGLGGLFALVFAFAYGRTGSMPPRTLAALLAAAGFLAIYLVPSLKFPANPPAVGQGVTIAFRTNMFFAMILISLIAMIIAVMVQRWLAVRQGGWKSALIAGALFIVIVAVGQSFLPDINEVPADFPALVLWRFRVASIGTQAILWTAIGLLFGYFAERVIAARPHPAPNSYAHQM